MGKDATKVRVALTGSVFASTSETATLPTTISEAVDTQEFDDLGYTTEDGVTFTFGKEVESIGGWQSNDPLRVIVTAEPKGVAFVLRQLDKSTLLQTFGGTITEPDDVGSPGEYEWHPPEQGESDVKVVIVEFVDGDVKYRWIFRRAQDQGEKEVTLMRTDAVNLPADYMVLAAEPDWGFVQSDDPALDPNPA